MNNPVLPLRDIVVFPQMIVPLFVGRDKSIKALEKAAAAYANSSEFKAASKKIGFTINYLNAKDFGKKIAKDDKKIKKLMNKLGLAKK